MNQASPAKEKSKKGLYIFLLVGIILIISFLSPIGWFLFNLHRSIKHTIVEADTGFRKATNSINPEELRSWALELIHNRAPKKEVLDTMPSSIRNLYADPPEDAWIDGSSVNVIWGGGFFHWGFYIGSTNETRPFMSENKEYPYNFEWRPGIYYTREANWKLQ